MSKPKPRTERYSFETSPWVQNINQSDLATLLEIKKDKLEALIDHKDYWIIRRTELIGKKMRALAYPKGKLRTVHERLKYHLNKIKQPVYLYSPRKGRSQRDNALAHQAQIQYLSIDIKQFYPSTSGEHIFRWAHHVAGMKADVAGMLTRLVTIDERMPFGSPLSPILTTLIHRPMFDQIYEACRLRGLRMTLWVDDLTISGKFTPGELVKQIRDIIRSNGLKSHKIKFRTGAKPVVITGLPVSASGVSAPRAVHQRIQDGFSAIRTSVTDSQRARAIDRLLGHIGTYRYYSGASSPEGRKAANQMASLRRRRALMDDACITPATVGPLAHDKGLPPDEGAAAPF